MRVVKLPAGGPCRVVDRRWIESNARISPVAHPLDNRPFESSASADAVAHTAHRPTTVKMGFLVGAEGRDPLPPPNRKKVFSGRACGNVSAAPRSATSVVRAAVKHLRATAADVAGAEPTSKLAVVRRCVMSTGRSPHATTGGLRWNGALPRRSWDFGDLE